jgi:hypothetical protein
VRGQAEGDWLYSAQTTISAGPVEGLVWAEDKAGNRTEVLVTLTL